MRESWLKTKAAARLIPCTFIGKHLRFSDDDIAEIMKAGARQPVTSRSPGGSPRSRLTLPRTATAQRLWRSLTGRRLRRRPTASTTRKLNREDPMAYAEKRGKGPAPWRVKYKLPSGTEASESGFETKAAALAWGRDQEARIREGRWTDPNAGKITVGEWIDRWLAIQDVGISTADHRDYLIRRFIRPAWGETAAALAQHRGDHQVGEHPARPDRDLPADRPRRPHPARAPSWATRPPPSRR